jgi:hypothetical protein
MQPIQLPVPVLNSPYWRINFRPLIYAPERIKSMSETIKLIEQTKVRLRGWDFPHLSNHSHQREHGSDWFGSWSDFDTRYEYWRMYFSGQFIHLHRIKETIPRWKKNLLENTKSHLSFLNDRNLDEAPGFISIVNFLYSVTEIYEFAARLCQRGVYDGDIQISIELKGIKGFVLTTDMDRCWNDYYAATEDSLQKEHVVSSTNLIASSAELSLNTAVWFFERFGWTNPSIDVLKNDQSIFLQRKTS